MKRELGRGLSQAYLSQIEERRAASPDPHDEGVAGAILQGLIRAFWWTDPEGYTSGLQSDLRAEDAKIDSCYLEASSNFRPTPS